MLSRSPKLSRNNFDLLRFLFAGTVLLVHSYQLSGYKQLAWIVSFLSSAIAVKSFFVVSGFLICMSFEHSSSLTSYMKKRVRRIYPAYCTVVLGGAIGLVLVSSVDAGSYFSLTWLKYLLSNLLFLNFLQPALPGVFEGNKIDAVNGALWTLKIEVMFYLAVPFFAYLLRRFSRLSVIVTFYVLSVLYALLLAEIAQRTGSALYAELARQLPGQLSYFMAGAFLYYFLPLFERHVRAFFATAVLILLFDMLLHPLPLLEPFALAVTVVFFGLFLYAGNFGKYGDFSYGLYIIHFPVIQLVIWSGWFRDSPWCFLLAVIFITLAGAIAMWHLVEKRFLFRSSHYITSTTQEQGK